MKRQTTRISRRGWHGKLMRYRAPKLPKRSTNLNAAAQKKLTAYVARLESV